MTLSGLVLRRTSRYFLLLMLGLVLLSIGAYAQDTATLIGTVTDPSGAAVANAKITITNTDNGFVRDTVTNSTGSYSARELPNGRYRLRAEATGFKVYEQTGITLNVNDTLRADIALQVGSHTESVTVEANAVQVQSDTNDVSQTVTDTQISELATNGRNVLQLTAIVPGASSEMPDFDLPVAQFQNRQVYFNGMRQDDNNWIIDGGEAYDRGGGILLVSPSQEALQEFKVETSNYAADLGNSSGGMISMAMKQGTKQFHGAAWEYDRNDYLDAVEYLAKKSSPIVIPELRYNAFGFNFGGPVEFKSSNPKTFFFYNQEWRREIIGTGRTVSRVPLPSETGQFGTANADLSTMGGAGPVVPTTTDATRLAAYTAAGVTAGQPFPNAIIPKSLFDPNVVAFLGGGYLLPPNANNGTGYFTAANTTTNYREEAFRIDHQFSDKLTLFGHLIYDSGYQQVPQPSWTGTTFSTLGSYENVPSWAAVVHATMSIKPTLLNELAFNYNGNDITLADWGKWTKSNGFNTAPLFSGVNNLNKMPSINVGGGGVGFNYDPGNWPWVNTWRSYQYKDDLSWNRGSHNVKFGAAWLHTHKNQEIFAQTAGSYGFYGGASGYGLGDFLLGDANNYTQVELQDEVSITFNTIDLYALDDWRVSKRLTLNLGLRWEGLPHAFDTNGRASSFYPALYQTSQEPTFLPGQGVFGDAMDTSGPGFETVSGVKLSNVLFYMNGVGLAGRNGIPKGLVNNHWDLFAPRLGFAYDLTGDGKTILRGGGGIFYERNAGNEQYNGGTNVPFTNNENVTNPDFSNPLEAWTTGLTASSSPYTPHGMYSVPENYPITTVYQYNLGLQRQLRSNAVLSVAYVGNNDFHLSDTSDLNILNESDPNRLYVCGGNCGYSGPLLGYDPNLDRPYLGWSGLNFVLNHGNSHYNGLQVSLRANSWKHLTFTGNYTYSHAFDTNDAQLFNNISDPHNPRYDYGTAGFDRRQIGVFSVVYDMPFFEHSGRAAKGVLGGWTLSGVILAQSGLPLNVNSSSDVLGLGGNTTDHAQQVSATTYPKTFATWFSPTSFTNPGPLQWGDALRNSVKGPGRMNFNISLYKAFHFTERVAFEFRADTFNTFNHTQFTGVDTGLGDYNSNPLLNGFGKINGDTQPRVFQLGAKLSF